MVDMHAFEAVASRWAVDSAECLYENFHDIQDIKYRFQFSLVD